MVSNILSVLLSTKGYNNNTCEEKNEVHTQAAGVRFIVPHLWAMVRSPINNLW